MSWRMASATKPGKAAAPTHGASLTTRRGPKNSRSEVVTIGAGLALELGLREGQAMLIEWGEQAHRGKLRLRPAEAGSQVGFPLKAHARARSGTLYLVLRDQPEGRSEATYRHQTLQHEIVELAAAKQRALILELPLRYLERPA